VTTVVLQPSPLKKSRPEITKEGWFIKKQRMVIEPLLYSQRQEGRRDYFLNSRVGNLAYYRRELADENQLQCGVNMNTHYLAKRMKDGCMESLVIPQGQGLMVIKAQGVHVVRVRDTPLILSQNEWTRDEHGNACVQEDSTSQ
jgi:hypothetical protein